VTSLYASSLAKNESESAFAWAATLPEGNLKGCAMCDIHSYLPQSTPEEKKAAAEFKARYVTEHEHWDR